MERDAVDLEMKEGDKQECETDNEGDAGIIIIRERKRNMVIRGRE